MAQFYHLLTLDCYGHKTTRFCIHGLFNGEPILIPDNY